MSENNIEKKTMDTAEIESLLNTIQSLVSPGNECTSIHDGLKTTSNIKTRLKEFRKKGFNEAQIHEISRGLEQGLNIEIYAKEYYNWKQMYELRRGMTDGLDISVYETPLFSASQMKEIRLGLVCHIDVSHYANLILSSTDMRQARKKLTAKAYQLNPLSFGRNIHDDSSMIDIRISDDCMAAFITIPSYSDKDYSVLDLENLLKKYEILYGIKKENLAKIVNKRIRDKEIKVAQGKKTENGKSGWFEFFFQTNPHKTAQTDPNALADYSQMFFAETVVPGQLLAKYHASELGNKGRTIMDIPVKGSRGKELAPLKGTGIVWDQEKDRYTADIKGHVAYNPDAGTLNVWPVYTIKGDANRYNGNITFDGTIHVIGSVKDMTILNATGDIIVDHFVEGALLKAGRNIIIHGGVNAGGHGMLDAGDKILGNFFESANLKSVGAIEGNYFLNCNIETSDRIVAKGNKGKIIGGTIKAVIGIEAVTVGNSTLKTYFEVGDVLSLEKQLQNCLIKKEKVSAELQQLTDGKYKLLQLMGYAACKKNSLYQKTCLAIRTKNKECFELETMEQHLLKLLPKAKSAYIHVFGKLHSNVCIIINNTRKRTIKSQQNLFLTGKK